MPLADIFDCAYRKVSSIPDARRGFSLIELSIVLAVIAMILGSGTAMLVAGTQAAQYNATINTMNTIEQALLNYSVAFNRLPCPSLLTTLPTSSTYGVEATNPGTGNCTGGAAPSTPSTFLYQNGSNTYRAAEGGVPTVSLKLPDSFMYDAWGHRIRYAVDTSLTSINTSYSNSGCTPSSNNICIGTNANVALPPPVGGCTPGYTTGMTVYDYTGATRSSNAAYVLVSHGANGHGAYTTTGTILNAGSTNSAEQSNCHCTGSAGSNTYNAQYYQEALSTATTGSPNTIYDDIVTYKESWQLRGGVSPAFSSSSSVCGGVAVWVADSGNNRVIGLTSAGTFVTQIGCSATTYGTTPYQSGPCTASSTAGQFHDPNKVAIDSSGNIWVVDTQNGRVEEFNSIGNYANNSIGGGTLNYPVGLAIDSTNNLWVVEVSNYDVKKYNSSGTLLGTFGSKNNSCNISQSSTWVTGEFCTGYGPQFTAIDSNGDIWVTDNQPYEIQQFSSTNPYNYAGKVTSPSTGIQGIAADSSGHIFLADEYNAYVYEYSATSPYNGVNSFNGNTQNYFGGTGNGAGLFNGLIDVSVDSSGNIWALDNVNKNVQKCSRAGVCSTPISTFNGGDTFNGPLTVTAAPSR